MKFLYVFGLCLLLAGCSTMDFRSANNIPILHSLEAVPRPYGVIGKVETKSDSLQPVYITRKRIQQIALSADADAVIIANINPLPDDPVFYTAPSESLDLENVWLFELIKVKQRDGSYQTVTTIPDRADMPLTAVFIRYMD